MEGGNEERGGRWRRRPFIKGNASPEPQGAASLPRREMSFSPYLLAARRGHEDVLGHASFWNLGDAKMLKHGVRERMITYKENKLPHRLE